MPYFSNLFAAFMGADRRIEIKLDELLEQVITGEQKTMDALTDLKTEVASFTTSVSAEISAAVAAIAAAATNNSGAVSAADVETVVTGLKNLQATVDAATAKFTPAPAPSA